METFFLVLHLIVAVSMIAVILLQRSEGGGLGFGGSTMGGAMTARGTANFLTRLTAILAGVFICVSLLLSVLASRRVNQKIIQGATSAQQVERKIPSSKDSQESPPQPASSPAQAPSTPREPARPLPPAPQS